MKCITRRIRHTAIRGAFIALAVSACLPLFALADTATVENTVSVSSSGDGSTHTKIRTTINGKLVEDIDTSEPGTTHTYVSTTTGSVAIDTRTETGSASEETLRALIEKLTLLIQYYVALLHTQ
jgi:hypothetical protein